MWYHAYPEEPEHALCHGFDGNIEIAFFQAYILSRPFKKVKKITFKCSNLQDPERQCQTEPTVA